MTEHSPDGLLRVKLELAYCGAEFHGWAIQPGLRTVEGVLTDALTKVFRPSADLKVTVAGRTDSGVHASHQVAHFDISAARWEKLIGRSQRTPQQALLSRLAGTLPHDVVVRGADLAPPGFDARFGALHRAYRYQISDRLETRWPTRHADILWLKPQELDVAAMNQAAGALLGEHDWLPYCRPRPGASTVRELQKFTWERDAAGLVVGTVQADAFCHHMVRNLVGGCVPVGLGRRAVSWPAEVLAAGVRNSAITVMPAQGLTLIDVAYPDAEQLAAQAVKTRTFRGEPH